SRRRSPQRVERGRTRHGSRADDSGGRGVRDASRGKTVLVVHQKNGHELVIRRAGLALGILAWMSARVFALNPALDVSQYAHTAWRIREGFAEGTVSTIAQTPDGYLWLGTDAGLYRFDGIRSVAWRPPSDQQLPSDTITHLLAAR